MKSINALAMGIVMACSTVAGMAQIKMPAPSPAQTVKQAFGLGEVTVEYSRPALKGRTMNDLVPAGKVWRTGANATTKIIFTDEVKIEGKTVAAGAYGIYSIPSKDSWQVMLYKDLKLAGNVADYNTANEVARFTVKPAKGANVESFTISFENVLPSSMTLQLAWGNVVVPVKITTDIDTRIMTSIKEAVSAEKPNAYTYFQAATYYYETNRDLTQAHTWVNAALAQNPKAFYMMLLKARIELKKGEKAAAIKSAEQTIALSKEVKNDDYVRMAEALIKSAK